MKTQKAIKQNEELERQFEKAISKFSQHFMSNSKWVRLIDKFVEHSDKIKKIQFKKVQYTQIEELYLNGNTAFGFDYWENGFEGHNSLGGWLAYKEIEHLIFPKIVDKETKSQQDLKQIAELINSLGEFVLEIDEEQLKLICYRN